MTEIIRRIPIADALRLPEVFKVALQDYISERNEVDDVYYSLEYVSASVSLIGIEFCRGEMVAVVQINEFEG